MCGIGGFVDYKHDARRCIAAAHRMQRALTPRGPDAAGAYHDPDAVLVHRRLIVIDPDGGAQPMHAPDGDTVLVYNGELYNTEEIRSDLLARGHTFEGHSDTEVLLHAFLEWDTDAFQRLNGIFAFAIWQKKARRLVLCRDRLGVKPLFVARIHGGLVFGSTIGAVLCHPAVEPEVDEDGLRALCDGLHKNDMRIVLDGVFNHSGLQFAPFVDAMEKGEASPYYGWFCFDKKMPYGYHTFGDWRYMPKLNLRNEACAQYFLSVGRYWLEKCHVDGWRLDVSPEVWPDFWRRFKSMMRKVNPDSLMVAECWDDSREWLTVGDMFDSTMHYVLSRNIWSRFCRHEISTAQFDCALNRAAMLYPQRTQEVLWTFLGSHDTQRIRTRAGGDLRMLHAASFFQFTYLGAPIIYYGDELGMEGGEDPDCRRPMRWDDVEGNLTRAHYQKLARLRAQLPALRVGRFRSHTAMENGLYAYRRETDTQQLLCVVNTGLEPVSARLELPKGMAGLAAVNDHYSGRSLAVADGGVHVSLKVGEGLILE